MRSELLLALIALALGLAGAWFTPPEPAMFQPTPPAAEHLRVMTWNVGRASEDGGQDMDDADVGHVAAVVTELAPRLCFLQEIDAGQVERLVAALGDGWTALVAPPDQRAVAVLGRTGTLADRALETPFHSTLSFDFRPDGVRDVVRAACVHASARSAKRRNRELGAVTDDLLKGGAARHTILAGDLNLDVDLDKRGDLFTNNVHLDVETYNYVAQHLVDAAHGRGSTAEPDRRLDYVFVGPGFKVIAAGPVPGRRRGAMDHDPVACDLFMR